MTMPQSIRQAVDLFSPLTRLFTEDTDVRPTIMPPASSIGESAKGMKPVLVAFARPIDEYLAKYRAFQNELSNKLASGGAAPGPSGGLSAGSAVASASLANIQRLSDLLDVERAASTDRTAWVMNEHEVVCQSEKLFLHPVNQHLALIAAVLSDDLPSTHRPFQVRSLGENPVRAESVLFAKLNGDPYYLAGRPDIVLVRSEVGERPRKPTKDGAAGDFNARPFAVFEVKDLHVLDRDSLEGLIKTVVRNFRTESKEWLKKARKLNGPGFHDQKTKTLLQQTILYAILERIKHVALYDNKTMLLLKFGNMKIDEGTTVQHLEKAGVGEWCHATLVPFDEPILGFGARTGGELAMQALLGFYIEAIQETPRIKRADGTFGI